MPNLTPFISFFSWILGLVLLNGCVGGSSPPTHYFILTAQANNQQPIKLSQNRILLLEPVEIPNYLSRTQIVTRSGENRLHLAPFSQWGDTLRENISRVMIENLTILLNTDHIQLSTTPLRQQATLRIHIQISRFEADTNGSVTLIARWRISDGKTGENKLSHQSKHSIGPVDSSNPEITVASMSTLLAQLSQEIATQIIKF